MLSPGSCGVRKPDGCVGYLVTLGTAVLVCVVQCKSAYVNSTVECLIRSPLNCSAAAFFPSLQELTVRSYRPQDTQRGGYKSMATCTCFDSDPNVTALALVVEAYESTATVTAKVLASLPTLVDLTNVTTLWLEGSGIYVLQRHFFNNFRNLVRLTVINTSNSDGFVFDPSTLRKLRKLYLANNTFEYASQDFIGVLSTLAEYGVDEIELAGNPYRCDCVLKPFQEWLRNSNSSKPVADKGLITCVRSTKGSLDTQPLLEAADEDLECVETDISSHLDAAYAVMSSLLAVVVIILLLVLWRKGSAYVSACLSTRRVNYATVDV